MIRELIFGPRYLLSVSLMFIVYSILSNLEQQPDTLSLGRPGTWSWTWHRQGSFHCTLAHTCYFSKYQYHTCTAHSNCHKKFNFVTLSVDMKLMTETMLKIQSRIKSAVVLAVISWDNSSSQLLATCDTRWHCYPCGHVTSVTLSHHNKMHFTCLDFIKQINMINVT